MPDTRVHLDQAEHNERFFGSFDQTTYSDWAVTVLFYAALHYVDAFLAHAGFKYPGGHHTRDGLVNSVTQLRTISTEYFRLKNRSSSARYYSSRFPAPDVERSRNTDLENIKRHIRGLLP